MNRSIISLCLLLITGAVFAGDDVHSYADLAQFQQQHLALNLAVDFEAKRLVGTADITFSRSADAGRQLALDTRDLLIRSVRMGGAGNGELLAFELGKNDPILGRALQVQLPTALPEAFTVSVLYETSPGASGLQWLNPRQTAGGEQPFLFSQSQAIHARSWVPDPGYAGGALHL